MKKIIVLQLLIFMVIMSSNLLLVSCSDDDNSTNTTNDASVKEGYCPDTNHPHVINLGLAGKWLCCNVGAETPEQFGNYYAFLRSEPYDNNAGTQYDKILKGGKYTYYEKDVVVETYPESIDYIWPSKSNFETLINNTEKEWTELNGVGGIKMTAKSGKKIFLPSGGRRYDDYIDNDSGFDTGYYWTSSKYDVGHYYDYLIAYCFCFFKNKETQAYEDIKNSITTLRKSYGMFVRACVFW